MKRQYEVLACVKIFLQKLGAFELHKAFLADEH